MLVKTRRTCYSTHRSNIQGDFYCSHKPICKKNKSPQLYAEMLIEGKPANMQLDKGAGSNIISKTAVRASQLITTNTILVMYNRQLVYPLRRCTLTLTNPKGTSRSHKETFEVVEQDWTPLLGCDTVERMNLITVNYGNFKHLHTAGDYTTSVAFNESLGEIDGEINLCVDPEINQSRNNPAGYRYRSKVK